MKGIIVFKGKYGATHQYADWVGQELSWPVIDADHASGSSVAPYETIIIGGSIYVGKWLMRDWVKKNLTALANKKLVIFIVAGTSPDEKDKLALIAKRNIPDEIKNRCEIYFLHGRMIRKNISGMDRFLLKVGAMMVRDPQEKKNMLSEFDDVKKEYILPILRAVKHPPVPQHQALK
ncbi:MAG: hypothetical protein C5B59_03790 [Bacteroidetes bacterium]|nr:MAG: hypothetical protein C5B59_03790 [Bacteroidota bacterium]